MYKNSDAHRDLSNLEHAWETSSANLENPKCLASKKPQCSMDLSANQSRRRNREASTSSKRSQKQSRTSVQTEVAINPQHMFSLQAPLRLMHSLCISFAAYWLVVLSCTCLAAPFPRTHKKIIMILASGETSEEWRTVTSLLVMSWYIDVALQFYRCSTLAFRSSCAFLILQFVSLSTPLGLKLCNSGKAVPVLVRMSSISSSFLARDSAIKPWPMKPRLRVVFILRLLEPSTDGLETTRIFEIVHLFSPLPSTFLLFINLPENMFFTNKFYSPTTDLPEVLSYMLGFAMCDLPESSCRIFLEKPDRAILPQPICRKCCQLQWEWPFTTFLTLPSRMLKKRRHIYSKKKDLLEGLAFTLGFAS